MSNPSEHILAVVLREFGAPVILDVGDFNKGISHSQLRAHGHILHTQIKVHDECIPGVVTTACD